MNANKEAAAIIRTLESEQFYAECPCCGEPIRLKDAGLFHLNNFTTEADQLYKQRLQQTSEDEKALMIRRKRIPQTSEVGAKAVNIGFVMERIAPSLKAFSFDHNDCRSLFDPIDYLIFEGLSERGSVSKILFVDIKTGAARLQANQKEIRSLVEKKKVELDIYQPEAKS